jgi:molybdate transport system substrate-binding protein
MLLVAGCGGDDDEQLTVYAASSLTEVFQELAPQHRYNFAGSDELATQIREGAGADVYAAASPRYPEELRDEGLVEQPVVFATNTLVLILPKQNPNGVRRVEDLAAGPFKLVVGAEGVPVGDYTRTVLANLGLARILDHVVSEEENVKGVLGKVALGEADAGFAYTTDAKAAARQLRALSLPARAQPKVRYELAIVRTSRNKAAARAFMRKVLGPTGRGVLSGAGFVLPKRRQP